MKNDVSLRVWVDEDLRDEITRLAALDHRKPSEYCREVISLHVWGHGECAQRKLEAANRDD